MTSKEYLINTYGYTAEQAQAVVDAWNNIPFYPTSFEQFAQDINNHIAIDNRKNLILLQRIMWAQPLPKASVYRGMTAEQMYAEYNNTPKVTYRDDPKPRKR